MNRGVDHQPIFFADSDRLELGHRLAEIHRRFDVTTLAYCLMTNHLHLVVRAPDGSLPNAMHHLTSVFSRHVNDRLGRDGPLFRGRYHSIPVESDAYLLWVVRYVHRNPLDIAGVDSPRDHRWSSYRTYLGLRPAPAFLDRAPVVELIGGDVGALVAITEDQPPSPPRTIGDLMALVRCALAVDDLAGGPGDPSTGTIDRTLLTLLERRTRDPGLRRLIADALGPRSTAARVRAGNRAEARLVADPVIARILGWLAGHVGEERCTA